MWIKQIEYVALIERMARAETRADWLMTRVNQLEHDNGTLRFESTGKPQSVPMFHKAATPDIDDHSETSFEDLGDDLAKKHGVSWDETGRVVLRT